MDAHLTVSCSSVLSLLVLDAPSSRSPPGWLRAASPPLPQLITVAIYLLSSWKGTGWGQWALSALALTFLSTDKNPAPPSWSGCVSGAFVAVRC